MKRLLALVLFFTPWLATADQIEPEGLIRPPISQEKKFYIEPTQIGFSKKQIFVNFDGEWQSVNAIYADEQGLYIKPRYFNYPWNCKECGVTNELWRRSCKTEGCTGVRPPKFSIPKPPRPFPPFPPFPPELLLPKEGS